jgi:hypothetical protein
MYGARKISASIQRQGSTKQLIHRYESFTSPSPPRGQENKTPTKGIKAKLSPSNRKENSPIRESFRNLLSVFKKDKTSSEDKWVGSLDRFKSGPAQERPCNEHEKLRVPVPLDMDAPTSNSPPLQSPRMGGSLMYLAHDSNGSYIGPPTSSWVECSAVMALDGLHLNFLHGSSPEHIISLSNCADVQSCSFTALSEQERALLPTEFTTQGYRIFDVFFYPNGRERFAVPSVQQRAKWVSAIWDFIIANQDSKSLFNAYFSDAPTGLTTNTSMRAPPTTQKEPSTSSDIDRGLPTIPQETPALLPGSSAPRCYTPSVYPPTQMLSPCHSQRRASSPSITNLAQKSMVKQRLAQMEDRAAGSSRNPQTEVRCALNPTSITASPVDSVLNMYAGSNSTPSPSRSIDRVNVDDCSVIKKYSLTDDAPTLHSAGPGSIPRVENSLFDWSQTIQRQNAEQRIHFSEIQRDILNVVPNVASLLENHIPPSHLANMHEALVHLCGSVEVTHGDVKRILQSIGFGDGNGAPEQQPITLRNIGRGGSQESSSMDTTALLSKLDVLMSTLYSTNGIGSSGILSSLRNDLKEALERLRIEDENKATQSQQQTETVRYLHELNGWLQTFVDNGTSQIHGVLSKLDHLATELGVQPPAIGSPEDQHPLPLVQGGVLNDIRQALGELKKREEHASALYESVNGLHAFLSSQAAAKNEFSQCILIFP